MLRPGCLTGLTVTGRNYNAELAKITRGAAAYLPGISREFFQWGTPPATVLARAVDRAAAGVPRIVLNLSSRRADGRPVMFQSIIDGAHDAYLRDLAQTLAVNNRPVLLLYLHEPHAHVRSYAPANATYANACELYIAATRHIVETWRAVNPLTTFCYQSTEYRLSIGDGPDCYAGPAHIDMVGYTGANGYTAQNPWKTPLQRLEQAREFIRWAGKPAGVFAGGSAEDPANPDRKAAFYDGVTEAMLSEPLMKLYIMVSTYYSDTKSAQWIDSSARSLAAWQTVVQRPYHA